MKRTMILIITLCLCTSATVSAESLFPSLSTPEPAAVTGEKAPSYGGMANVDSDDVQPYAEGGQVVTYENVDEQGYQDFGLYLNELGYEVVAQNVQGRTAEMKLSDGRFNIGMVYYGDEQKMLLIYEKGVEYETGFASLFRRRGGDPVMMSEFSNMAAYLKQNGRVVAIPGTYCERNLSEDWSDIIAVSTGMYHVVGLKRDGTVIASLVDGEDDYGQCDVGNWRSIVAISAGLDYTIGLKQDGTVVATGNNMFGNLDVSDWIGITAISAKYGTVGLKSDGTVLITGRKLYDCDVSKWENIIAVSTGIGYVVGLKADGTVVATGSNEYGQCAVSEWRDIVQISTGYYHTVGLKSDGTVVAAGMTEDGERFNVSEFRDVVAVAGTRYGIMALKRNGDVVTTRGDVIATDLFVPSDE